MDQFDLKVFYYVCLFFSVEEWNERGCIDLSLPHILFPRSVGGAGISDGFESETNNTHRSNRCVDACLSRKSMGV